MDLGETGITQGLDYRQEVVMAGYTYIQGLEAALVMKVDVKQILCRAGPIQ